jgi:5-methylcytosine-specific restriction endonuclease McrA
MTQKQHVPELLRRQVRIRAKGRCEYCLVPDEDTFFPHEPDHIIAEKHGGATTLDNLAWACAACNRYKGSDLASIDPLTQRLAALFNPRRQQWARHFRLEDARIEPLTAAGRATVRLLRLNDERRIEERQALMERGFYPPH